MRLFCLSVLLAYSPLFLYSQVKADYLKTLYNEEENLVSLIAMPTNGKELMNERGRTVKHFEMPDGSKKALLTGGTSLHYETDENKWENIQLDLIHDQSLELIINNTNTIQSSFPLIMNALSNVKIKSSKMKEIEYGANLKVCLINSNNEKKELAVINPAKGYVHKNVIVYENVFFNTDLNYSVVPDKVKQNFIIKSYPSFLDNVEGRVAISEDILLPEGWKLLCDGEELKGDKFTSNGVVVLNENNEKVYYIPVPEIYELEDRNAQYHSLDGKSNKESYFLTRSGNLYTISILIDVNWLKNRNYPLIVDPTVTQYGVQSGWQKQPADFLENDMYYTYISQASGVKYNAWIKFPLSGLNVSNNINSVSLTLYCNGVGSSAAGTVSVNDVTGSYGFYGGYNAAAFVDLGNGAYSSFSCGGIGTYGGINLGTQACSDLAGKISSGFFQIGLSTTFYEFKRFTGGSSYLVIDYSNCAPAPAPTIVTNNGPRCPSNTVNLTAAGLAPSGQVINFSTGSFSHVEIPNNAIFNFTASNTVEAWVKPSSYTGEGIIFNKENQYEAKIENNGTLQWAYQRNGGPTWAWVNTGAVIPLNTWTHVAFVHNSGTGSISTYINGNLMHTGNIGVGALAVTTNTLRIGNRATNSPFHGAIDNVRLWSVARTAAEILADMRYETPTQIAGLVAHYPLNGNGNAGAAGINGTLVNAGGASWVAANYYNYTWSGPGTLPASSTNETQTATLPNTPGPWAYTVSATIGTGCTSTNVGRTMVLSNQSTPPLETSLSNIGTCSGASVTLSVNEPTRRGGEIDRTTWTAGSGAAPGFNLNGATNENFRLNMTDPWGNTAMGWEARPIVGTPTDADGGWNGDRFPIDNSKTYRFTVWVKRSVVGDGRFYLGLNGFNNVTNTGVVRLSSGAIETNPYFYHGVDFKQDEWMLVVGHVFPYTHNGTTLHPQSGIYKLNGDVLPILDDYKWLANSTHALHRSYLYYTSNAATRQQFMYPRVDILDGSEPSIQDLLNGFDQNGGLTPGATWQWFNGSCGGTSAGSGNTINVAPTSDARYFVRAQDACGTSVCKEATVVIGPAPTAPTIIADGSTTICAGNEVELKGRSSAAGGALSFNGTSDFVNMGNPPDVKVTKNVTIEMWLKPTSFAGRRNPINKAYGGEYTFTLESDGTMNCYFGLMGGNGTPYMGFNSVTPLVLNQWNHIAFVREDNTLRFYVNGVQTNTGLGSPDPTSYVFTTPLTGAQSSENLMLGNGYAGYYAGEMDEVRIWKIARTAAQIASNMNRSITPGSPDLVGYWRFDEASGTAVLDASGKSQTGIMGGSTTRVSNSLAPIKPNFTWAPMASLTTLTDSTVRATPTATTIYSLVATSAHGCNSLTSTQTITLPATAAALSNHLESATCVVKNNNWTHFQHSSGRLIASIQASYPNPNTTITSTSYVSGSPTSVADCQNPSNASLNTAAMQRNWVINATPAIAGNVIVRLYFNNSELSALSAAANSNSNPSDDVNSRSDLQLTKYSGSNQDGIFGDNTTCGWSGALPTTAISRHSQTANGVTSYGSVANSQYVDFTISSFSELWLHGSANVSPLPVELLYFLGNCENGISQLVWSTASEQNNAFFIVERSKDGTNWEFVERVSGAGNSNAQLMYQVSDKKANGANYYRLSQQDYDGTIEVFASIYVACQNAEQNTITVYPNPASENINVAIYVNNDYFNSIIKLMDATGKTVYTAGLDLEKGNNNFGIPLLSLASGTYFLQVLNDKMVLPTQKIIIR